MHGRDEPPLAPSDRRWHGRGYLPHFESSTVFRLVTCRPGDSLTREVAGRLPAEVQGSADAEPESATSQLGLGSGALGWQLSVMSTVTITLPDPLDATLGERVRNSGARSKEEYLLSLVESDCAAGELERVLAERMGGPFAPLEPDWKERVRSVAANRREQ